MPNATVDMTPQRKDIKTAPPDGFVMLIPLPFGKLLHRRDKASRMIMQQRQSNRRGRRGAEEEPTNIGIEFANEETRWYEFRQCIVDHNLEDSNGNRLDFNNKMAFQMLDPKVGQEIEMYIDELNREEDEEDLELFPALSAQSSSEENENTPTLAPAN